MYSTLYNIINDIKNQLKKRENSASVIYISWLYSYMIYVFNLIYAYCLKADVKVELKGRW